MSVFNLIREDMTIMLTGHILELPYRDNQRQISCIPEGTYKIVHHTSPKFGKSLLVLDVRNRSEILIHAGNTTKDTKGCLLPGNISGIDKVVSSREKLAALLRHIPKTGATMVILDMNDIDVL